MVAQAAKRVAGGGYASLREVALAVAAAALLAAGAVGCGRSGAPGVGGAAVAGGGRARLTVVAAENFWGSIAAQLAGGRASVESIVVDPTTDPHSYEPTAADARLLAGATMVIVEGLGYDNWARRLLEASGEGGRTILDVGRLLGLPGGANPHRWYYPSDVRRVISAIVDDYVRLDPADEPVFEERRRRLERSGLAEYDRLREEIRSRFAGVPVGYSESIFQGLGEDLDLRLATPPGFAKAIAEGTDVTASDLQATEEQARDRRIRVWVLNSQNITPEVERVDQIALREGIPLVRITETLSPPTASFEGWQTSQLRRLLAALEHASGAGGR